MTRPMPDYDGAPPAERRFCFIAPQLILGEVLMPHHHLVRWG